MNAKYIYRVYRTIDFVSDLMDGHQYDYNCAMGMMQMVDPIPYEEQCALLDFMNRHMDVLVPAYHEGYEKLEQVVAAIVAKQNQST